MRFSVIYLVSLLLVVPSLVASKIENPASARVSLHPDHGDIVRFQGPRSQHLGLVVGSHQHQGGNVNIAPLPPNLRGHPHPIIAYNDHLVNTHPGNVATTGHSAPHLASDLQEYHRNNPPTLYPASGPVEGSPNH
ncbi:hypothetical protein M378DRAFT_166228 [Amanita muscaria Koide BX008]|uniref:Uncharacterized protein n=1 Tax=Amanita muscaria (strain Koide BX008) TaxID=946122 RepID=A0A0C2WKL4_AMAMK|nr:hypothetical protein M378DRAFT_166228 [Amanita muscaria Koide BX008]